MYSYILSRDAHRTLIIRDYCCSYHAKHKLHYKKPNYSNDNSHAESSIIVHPEKGVNLAFYRWKMPVAQTSLLVRFVSQGVSSWRHSKLGQFVEISQGSQNSLVDQELIKEALSVKSLPICRNSKSPYRRSQYSKRPNSRLIQVQLIPYF